MRYAIKFLPALLLSLTLGACSMGGGETGTGVAEGPDTSVGVITGFGSIFVNGVEFFTDNSRISIDDAEASESSLRVGMVVTVNGTINNDGTGTANTVVFKDEVEGPIGSTSLSLDGTGSIVVLGQTVIIDAHTTFDSDSATVNTMAALQAGHVVEVSGFSDGIGTIYATHLKLKRESLGSGEEIELKGLIANLNTTARTFTIGSLTIQYDSATRFDDLSQSQLANGLFVEVKSTSAPTTSLLASEIELEDSGKKGLVRDSGEKLELEGIVTTAYDAANGRFAINGQNAICNANTEFENGGDCTGLSEGLRIDLYGVFDSQQLVATRIELEEHGDMEITATVHGLGDKQLHMIGLTIAVGNETILTDERDEDPYTPLPRFGFADIAQGDLLEVRVTYDPSATPPYTATRIERDDLEPGLESTIEIEGTVDAVTANTITIGGLELDLTGTGLSFQVGERAELEGTYDSNSGLIQITSGDVEVENKPGVESEEEDREEND